MLCVTVAPHYSVRATAAGTPAAHHRLCGFRRIGHSEKEGFCERAHNAFRSHPATPAGLQPLARLRRTIGCAAFAA